MKKKIPFENLKEFDFITYRDNNLLGIEGKYYNLTKYFNWAYYIIWEEWREKLDLLREYLNKSETDLGMIPISDCDPSMV